MADYSSQIEQKQKRWSALKLERQSWFDHWQEISTVLLPRHGRFLLTDRNRGEKKHNEINDSTATRSLRVLAAGLMAGMTSPARHWFRLQTPDDELNQSRAVREWLEITTRRMRDVFNHSNTYRALHALYEELGAFGTGASFILESFDYVVRHKPLTIGEYAIALDAEDNVSTIYREFQMTVAQLVEEFGEDAVSTYVRSLYKNGHSYDKWVSVTHVVQPRMERNPRLRDAQNMPWQSCYFESSNHDGKYLRESGYKRFPVLAPRWAVTSGDVYGNSPGMEALGDIKQLQHNQEKKALGIDYQVQPPLQVPSAMRGRGVAGQPGGVTYLDQVGPQGAIRSAFDVNLRLGDLLQDTQDVRQRISRAFYEDLFLMLANSDRREITAREIAERHEEKLLMLGPVLERLHNELLSPLIDVTFDRMLEAGIVPLPPVELQGIELKVEFISMLAQAQRAVGLSSVDRLLGTVASIAQLKPDIMDKVDTDKAVDEYADMLGIDPTLIVGDKQVALVRQQRAQQEAAMKAAAMAPQATQAAKNLSETDTEGRNALTDAVDMFSGYTRR